MFSFLFESLIAFLESDNKRKFVKKDPMRGYAAIFMLLITVMGYITTYKIASFSTRHSMRPVWFILSLLTMPIATLVTMLVILICVLWPLSAVMGFEVGPVVDQFQLLLWAAELPLIEWLAGIVANFMNNNIGIDTDANVVQLALGFYCSFAPAIMSLAIIKGLIFYRGKQQLQYEYEENYQY